jgi:hypothetical protein
VVPCDTTRSYFHHFVTRIEKNWTYIFNTFFNKYIYVHIIIGWKHGKICQKTSPTYSHNRIYGINIFIFYPFENIKNLTKIVLSSHFHIFEAKMKHVFSYTCISKNVLKCILKHVIFQYYAMNSKNVLSSTIEINNIHTFNVLRHNLSNFSKKRKSIPCWHTLSCFHPIIYEAKLWIETYSKI